MLPWNPLPEPPAGARWFAIPGAVREENTAALYTARPRVRVGGESEDDEETLNPSDEEYSQEYSSNDHSEEDSE
jgi:hypothetical protein